MEVVSRGVGCEAGALSVTTGDGMGFDMDIDILTGSWMKMGSNFGDDVVLAKGGASSQVHNENSEQK